MKSLALYVDKWYIVGAYCGDGNPQPLRPPNGDDRIWLYFHNDREANRVSYSLKYKEKALAEAIDYYKDIFNLIPASIGATYKRFGRNVEIKSIFDTAGIFDDLRSDYREDEKINTFISFSSDISYQSQSIFLGLLSEHGFDVQEYVAHIGHLALEYAYRHHLFSDCGYVFVANACNENLRFAIYEQIDSLFVCRKECFYEGLGIDLRKRAILEDVVEKLEVESRFICNETERIDEFCYLGQYVDDWISRIDSDSSSSYMPTQLGNLHLKKQEGNSYPVSVMRSEIGERTSVIIDDIVGAMFRMLTEYGIGTQDLTHILFLGNSFENKLFKNKLIKQTGLDTTRILHFREERLSDIVSVYAELDCTQFKDAEEDHQKKSQAEKELAEQAKQDREALKAAKEKEEKEKADQEAEKQKERNLKEAIEYAEGAERNEEYENAIGFYKTAQALSPNDSYVQGKIEELGNIIADIRSKKKQFDKYIENAKQCFDEKDWDGAIVQSQMALGVMPMSDEATQVLNRAKDMSNRYARMKECLSQIDFFIDQGAFDKALEEMRNAELLELNDSILEEKKELIKEKQHEQKERIERETKILEDALIEKNYDIAIQQCELLIKIDANSQSQWVERKAEIVSMREIANTNRKRFQELTELIDRALLNEEWERLELLCIDALKIKDDASIQDKLSKARRKREIADAQRQFDDAKNAEDWKLVIDCSIQYPSLKENRENNKTIQYARRQIQFSRNNKGKNRVISGDKIPQKDTTELDGLEQKRKYIRPKGIKKNTSLADKPITLLQEPIADISIDSSKRCFPHPKKFEKKEIDKEETVTIDVNTNISSPSKKRKFPKVSHNKK